VKAIGEDQRNNSWPIPRSFGVMYAARRPVYDLIENENCVPTREVSQPERQIKVEYSLIFEKRFRIFSGNIRTPSQSKMNHRRVETLRPARYILGLLARASSSGAIFLQGKRLLRHASRFCDGGGFFHASQ
jgi:hypothetical protein